MTRLPVTSEEMRAAIQEVHLALPKFQLTTDTMPATVRVYRDAMDRYDGEAVAGAAKLIIRTAEKFPSPAIWRAACQEWVKRNRASIEYTGSHDAEGRDIICRVCRSVPRWAWLKINTTPFSVPRVADAKVYVGDAVMRCISVCDLARHGPNDLTSALPDTFIEWAG